MRFRNDINGLRAVAVLPVLLFHAQWKTFGGGFLGVDVFFVISGYLLTSLIISDTSGARFSLLKFYDRRVRRILPALIFVCFVTTVMAIFFMLPYDLKNYGQSLVASVLSANNILLYLTSGYWDLAAEFKPLSHTWSLAVEEQFYLLLPAVVLACNLNKPGNRITFLVITILASSSLALSTLSLDKEFNFLMITHRSWELLAGSMAAIILQNRSFRSNALAALGLVFILVSYVAPSFWFGDRITLNLLTVIGTILIIIFSADDLPIGRLLSVRSLAVVGTLSYSIYLIHMPVLVFLRLAVEGKPSVAVQTIAVLCSLPLAHFSWKYVECPSRNKNVTSNTRFFFLIGGGSFLLLLAGLTFHLTYGLQKYNEKWSYGVNPQRFADRPFSLTKSAFSDDGRKKLLVIGNSFARDFINMMLANGIDHNYEIVYLFTGSYLVPEDKINLLKSADITIAVSSFGMRGIVDDNQVSKDSLGLREFLKSTTNGNYYLLGTKNFGYNNSFVLWRSYDKVLTHTVAPNASSITANNIERKIWGDKYIDTFAAISDENGLVPLFTPSHRFISFDTDHATCQGASYLGKLLIERSNLKEVLNVQNRDEWTNGKKSQEPCDQLIAAS